VIILANRGWSIHVVLLEQDRADQPGDAGFVGEDADEVGPWLDLLLYPGPVRQLRHCNLIVMDLIDVAAKSLACWWMSLGDSLLYELGQNRLRMGYGQEPRGASLFAAS
jgi:hypothetical protein